MGGDFEGGEVATPDRAGCGRRGGNDGWDEGRQPDGTTKPVRISFDPELRAGGGLRRFCLRGPSYRWFRDDRRRDIPDRCGAILRYATNINVQGVSLDTVGLILMIAGAVGMILGFGQEMMRAKARREDVALAERREAQRYRDQQQYQDPGQYREPPRR